MESIVPVFAGVGQFVPRLRPFRKRQGPPCCTNGAASRSRSFTGARARAVTASASIVRGGLDPAGMHGDPHAHGPGGLAQECGLAFVAFDEVHLGHAEAGQDQARKAGTAAEVDEAPGARRQRAATVGRCRNVATPGVFEVAWPTRLMRLFQRTARPASARWGAAFHVKRRDSRAAIRRQRPVRQPFGMPVQQREGGRRHAGKHSCAAPSALRSRRTARQGPAASCPAARGSRGAPASASGGARPTGRRGRHSRETSGAAALLATESRDLGRPDVQVGTVRGLDLNLRRDIARGQMRRQPAQPLQSISGRPSSSGPSAVGRRVDLRGRAGWLRAVEGSAVAQAAAKAAIHAPALCARCGRTRSGRRRSR